jgi:glycosyltransferase involved in cell wall biosynthesis
MKTKKISVIIPVYNGEKTINQCLNSVLNQTYDNYEVIVIDNNSTDNIKGIINEFQKKNSKIKYFLEIKRGRGAARNAGIKKSEGEIILMTDSDCIVPKNWISELIRPIINDKETVVMGSEEDKIKNYWTRNIQRANQKFIKKNLQNNHVSHLDTKNFAIKASIIKKLMFDSNLLALEDFDFYLRLKKDSRIKFIPKIKVRHNHKSSFISVIKLNFERGYWITKIKEKYRLKKEIDKEPMFESISIKNFLTFPFWMILQFITNPIQESYFLLVSEVSWRMGILWAKLN